MARILDAQVFLSSVASTFPVGLLSVDSTRSSWSCYFIPETSPECRRRAFELIHDRESWEKGIIIAKENYTSKEIWAGHVPRLDVVYAIFLPNLIILKLQL